MFGVAVAARRNQRRADAKSIRIYVAWILALLIGREKAKVEDKNKVEKETLKEKE